MLFLPLSALSQEMLLSYEYFPNPSGESPESRRKVQLAWLNRENRCALQVM